MKMNKIYGLCAVQLMGVSVQLMNRVAGSMIVFLGVIGIMTVRYFSNGTWKETARVRRVIEVTDAYIKFETDRIRYCIDFGMVEDNAMPIAA